MFASYVTGIKLSMNTLKLCRANLPFLWCSTTTQAAWMVRKSNLDRPNSLVTYSSIHLFQYAWEAKWLGITDNPNTFQNPAEVYQLGRPSLLKKYSMTFWIHSYSSWHTFDCWDFVKPLVTNYRYTTNWWILWNRYHISSSGLRTIIISLVKSPLYLGS